MFSVIVLRRFPVSLVARSLPLSCLSAAATHRAPFRPCLDRRPCGKELNACKWSLFRPGHHQVSLSPAASCCLSTVAPPGEGHLIYKGTLGTAVRGVKIFSYSTSGTSLFLVPQILLKTGLGVQSLALQVAFCGIIGFFTFLTPILLHLVTRGYVVRLYYHPDHDTYTAVTYGVFLNERRTVFHQDQVRVPGAARMFTTFYAGRAGLLVNPDLFSSPHHYNHLMGYDKPFSFQEDHLDRPES